MNIVKKVQYRNYLVILGFFFFIFIGHIIVSDFPKRMFIYSDELRYLELARNMLNGKLSVHNIDVDYQKILYSLLITPAFLMKSPIMQIRVIGWINCLISASAVIPVWLLVRNTLLSNGKRYFIIVMTGVMPYTLLTMTFMSEVLFFPLSLWVLWAGYHLFYEQNMKKQVKYVILFGALCYILYLNKEIALYYLIAYILVVSVSAIGDRKNRKSQLLLCIVTITVFIVCFVAMKVFIFSGMGNSYNQMSVKSVLSLEKIMYMCYAFVYNGLFALIAFGVFPVLLTITGLLRGDLSHKKFFWFVLLAWIIGIGTIVYTISVREDFPNISIRQHIRYLEPLLIPFLIEMFQYGPRKVERKWILAGTVIFCILTAVFLRQIGVGSPADQQSLAYYTEVVNEVNRMLKSSNWGVWSVKLIVVVVCVTLVVLLYKRSYKCFLCFFAGCFCVVNVINCYLVYQDYRNYYQITKNEQLEMVEVASMLKEVEGNILIISPQGLGDDNRLIDTYLDFQNTYITSVEYPDKDPNQITLYIDMENTLSDNVIQLDSEKVIAEYPYEYYDDLTHVEYILADSNVKLSNVEIIGTYQIEYEYVLYKNLVPEMVFIERR